jgi:hypothetical protein
LLPTLAVEAPTQLIVHRNDIRSLGKAVICMLFRVFRLLTEKGTDGLNMKIYQPAYEEFVLNILPILTYSRYLTIIRTTIMFTMRLNYGW